MLLPLVLLFIVVPLAEIYVIIKVGGAIGTGPTVAILLADSLLGAILLRSQGRGAWVRFNQALAESRMPAREVFDGVLIIFGGALLLTPGFITDVLGLILLIPPTRAAVRAFMTRFVVGRFAIGPRAAAWGYGRVRDRQAQPRPAPGPDPGFTRRRGPQPDDIEGSGHELRDDERLPPVEGEPPPR